MRARNKARKRALDILFESELRSLPLGDTLAERIAAGEPPVNDYTVELVEGVRMHRQRIDGVLSEFARGWTLQRMPAVDRNLLRIGTFEVLYNDEVPDEVAVSEAVGLARELSTEESPAFVNGLLANVVRNKSSISG